MIQRLHALFEYGTLSQSAGSPDPAGTHTVGTRLPLILNPDAQQLHSISGAPVLCDTFPNGVTASLMRNIPSLGLSGGGR